MIDQADRSAAPPPEWEPLLSAEDWRYLDALLPSEQMHDLKVILEEAASPDFGAKLVERIKEVHTELPDLPPGHVIMLAVPLAA